MARRFLRKYRLTAIQVITEATSAREQYKPINAPDQLTAVAEEEPLSDCDVSKPQLGGARTQRKAKDLEPSRPRLNRAICSNCEKLPLPLLPTSPVAAPSRTETTLRAAVCSKKISEVPSLQVAEGRAAAADAQRCGPEEVDATTETLSGLTPESSNS
mmetsp:Transcript_99742/g.253607  ORF Transcript_99742/g.253607 Transcript_99742/m.253607 type:complete len:158 (-) Transcript_99742:856-1329(-)